MKNRGKPRQVARLPVNDAQILEAQTLLVEYVNTGRRPENLSDAWEQLSERDKQEVADSVREQHLSYTDLKFLSEALRYRSSHIAVFAIAATLLVGGGVYWVTAAPFFSSFMGCVSGTGVGMVCLDGYKNKFRIQDRDKCERLCTYKMPSDMKPAF
jgi:hypothetical protein